MAANNPIKIEDAPEADDGRDSGSEELNEPSSSNAPSTSTQSKKKRNRAKGKGLEKLQDVLSKKGGSGQKIPQALVSSVVEAVNAQGGVGSQEEAEEEQLGLPKGTLSNGKGKETGGKRPVNEEEVRKALEILNAVEVMQGKTSLGGKHQKDMGEHKFWKTQPVPHWGERRPDSTTDGPIEADTPPDQIRKDPCPLPANFVWSTVDLSDAEQLREVYELLSQNYVEDSDASFRFQYSAEFLNWALRGPGYHREWHIGVRGQPKNKLVAFIAGIPIKLRVRDHVMDTVEINFLCVHKKLRSKRLAPVMIKEVTRQVHLKGMFQAVYTAGVVLPTPVSVSRYYHRTLNIPKLVDVKFTHIPRNSTLARMIKLNELPREPSIPGLREMEDRDVEQVYVLQSRYMERFKMVPMFSKEEVTHQFLSGRGTGELGAEGTPGRRAGQVTWTYVVENPDTHAVTDFFSFYALPSTIMKSTKHSLLQAAYTFYYATNVAFEPSPDGSGLLQKRLQTLMTDMLIMANNAKFDVLNAMTLMDNWYFLRDLKFGQGDGYLNFYLYNWRTAPLEGHQALPVSGGGGQGIGRGIGLVML